MVEKEKTFSEIYQTFLSRQEIQKHDSFTAACNVWLQFENNQVNQKKKKKTRSILKLIEYT